VKTYSVFRSCINWPSETEKRTPRKHSTSPKCRIAITLLGRNRIYRRLRSSDDDLPSPSCPKLASRSTSTNRSRVGLRSEVVDRSLDGVDDSVEVEVDGAQIRFSRGVGESPERTACVREDVVDRAAHTIKRLRKKWLRIRHRKKKMKLNPSFAAASSNSETTSSHCVTSVFLKYAASFVLRGKIGSDHLV
jgi:hypothetical protein